MTLGRMSAAWLACADFEWAKARQAGLEYAAHEIDAMEAKRRKTVADKAAGVYVDRARVTARAIGADRLTA